MEEGRMDGERGDGDLETLKPRLFPILYLTVCASIGGLVFGFYVGFIIARFGMLTNDNSILHETYKTGLVGAIVGAAAGGLTNDCVGRKSSILIADTLVFIGGVLLKLISFGDEYCLDSMGNTFIALGVGMASMTSPLYISEFSPPKLRDTFVSINFIFYGVGKLAFFFLYIDSVRTANHIIALAGIPALFQFCLMFSFPEPPMWLYKKDQEVDAIKALKNIYTCCEVGKEYDVFRLSIRREAAAEDEISYSGRNIFCRIRSALSSPSVRKQFVVGTALQIVQQLVGTNALIYCASSIRRMSGHGASNLKNDISFMKETLGESHGMSSIVSGFFCTLCLVAGYGKRKILCWSIYCMLAFAVCLSFMYIVSPNTTEFVSWSESTIHFKNNTCLSYLAAPDADSWDCLTCLGASTGCGFCRGTHNNILGQSSGACLDVEPNGTSQACSAKNRSWSTKKCEYNVFKLPVLMSYHYYAFFYSISLEIIPWIMNSQMYPTEVRGIYGGIAAVAYWTSFLIIILSSFFLTKIGGPLLVFLLISLFCFFASWLIKLFVPENVSFFISARAKKGY
ncbi:hypothetical protein MKW94_028290 [Papaver nudicaule]|uniref:Major facilitator superfamily (MFS) profile domain-containing protein n=1 Tax=Papaver nudicaule TaxID=74823 RepID=A0AA41V5M2_PAPNU|nr:hypothetical protein [Papaver nudicaule]